MGEATPAATWVCPHCGHTPAGVGTLDICPACQGLALVAGRFRVGRALGRGGMSYVFEATDAVSGGRFAVKVVSIESAREWKGLELFERGTQILQSLSHEALPKIVCFERDARGRLYQVREIYDGGTLDSRVQHGERVDRRSAHHLLKALLQVVDYLHRQTPAILHRDIKPANVMFRTSGDLNPVLVDFDAAALLESRGTGTTIVVSPGYTAPEQLMGEPSPASDLYSIGMTMLFVLSHVSPSELEKRHGRYVVAHLLRELEPATAHVLSRLIEPDLQLRYSHASAALRDLRGLGSHQASKNTARSEPFWNRKLEIGGVSLFRISVGVLVGGLFMLLLLARWQEARVSSQRGLESASER